jgi:hypothetical protein
LPTFFDEEKIQVAKVPTFQATLDHGRFQVTNRTGNDLAYWNQAGCQTVGVILGGQVAHQSGDTEVRAHLR